jgi:hypothetical protein
MLIRSQVFAKKAKTFSHENGTATEKALHFRGSSTSVGDQFFWIVVCPRWSSVKSFIKTRSKMRGWTRKSTLPQREEVMKRKIALPKIDLMRASHQPKIYTQLLFLEGGKNAKNLVSYFADLARAGVALFRHGRKD